VLSKRKPSTIHAAESHLKKQILPTLGRMKLSEIGVENQQSFVTRLSGTVSRKTLLNVLGTLSSMLTTGVTSARASRSGSWHCPSEAFERKPHHSPRTRHAPSSRKRKGNTA
jgi:hypothetical protein